MELQFFLNKSKIRKLGQSWYVSKWKLKLFYVLLSQEVKNLFSSPDFTFFCSLSLLYSNISLGTSSTPRYVFLACCIGTGETLSLAITICTCSQTQRDRKVSLIYYIILYSYWRVLFKHIGTPDLTDDKNVCNLSGMWNYVYSNFNPNKDNENSFYRVKTILDIHISLAKTVV